MKYLKSFEGFYNHDTEWEHNGVKFKVTDGGPSNVAGAVQIDNLTVEVDGHEYIFEVASLASGDVFVYPQFTSESKFAKHFKFKEDKAIDYDQFLKLSDFLSCSQSDCVGDKEEIDGFEMEITDFNHMGGVEEGYVTIEIDGDEICFDITQDATGRNMAVRVEFSTDSDEELAKEYGLEIDDELESILFSVYDSF